MVAEQAMSGQPEGYESLSASVAAVPPQEARREWTAEEWREWSAWRLIGERRVGLLGPSG